MEKPFYKKLSAYPLIMPFQTEIVFILRIGEGVVQMNAKAKVKIFVDIAMTVLLMLLMAFELIGRTAHEWIGIGMLLLFILHHGLNRNWSKSLLRGNYTPFHVLQTLLAALVLLSMLGSMISAVLVSREVFAFLPLHGGRGLGRTLHMLSAYWGFLFLSLHLGLHWNLIMGMAGRLYKTPSRLRRIVLRIVGVCIALFGVYAFFRREIPNYLFLKTQFVFFDFEEPLFFFFLDYLGIMGLFAWIGHYLAKLLRWKKKEQKKK